MDTKAGDPRDVDNVENAFGESVGLDLVGDKLSGLRRAPVIHLLGP